MRELAPGTMLGGCRIEGVVGRGGMGVVYRAHQLDLDRDVAVKVIAPELVEDTQNRERFLREARAAGAVEHPNVVPVHGVGLEDGRTYLVMRYVAGDDLRTVVLGEGAFEPRRAAAVAAQLGDALDAIHRAGYVHRDVKPQNVMLDAAGHVYLSDFGLAKRALGTAGPTRPEEWVGTLDYVAPEQIRGERVEARADIYALGGVLYFMLTGRVPFARETDHQKLWAHLADPPPRAGDVRPELPAALDEVIGRAMAKDPAERHPSAGDLGRAALAAAGAGHDAGEERTVAQGAAAPATRRVARGRSRLGPLVAAAALIVAAVAALVPLRGGDPPERRAAAEPKATATPTATATATPPQIGWTTKDAGYRPRGVAVARGLVFVVNSHEGRIARIDAATGKRVGWQKWIGHLTKSVAADGDTVWVAGGQRRAVMAVSAQTGGIERLIQMPVQPRLVAAGRTGLWVVCSASELTGPSFLFRYDRESLRQIQEPLELGGPISAIALGGGYAWLARADNRIVVRVAPDMTHETGAWLEAPASELAYGARHLWASVPTDDAVARIDPDTKLAVTSRVAGRPEQLVVARYRVFVASSTDHKVVLLSARTGRRVDSVNVPENPYGLAAGGRHVFVTGLGKSTLTRLDF